jgi:hypothetical protein
MNNAGIVINLFSGPGAGKSTIRAGVFNILKTRGINCEEVFEWIKYKVYEKNVYVFKDQLYVFAKQRKYLREVINDVDVIITDSPILLSAIYDNEKDPLFQQFVLSEFNKFNNINFFIKRVKPYVKVGRNQSEEEARLIDEIVEKYLIDNNIPYLTINGNEEAKNLISNCIINLI